MSSMRELMPAPRALAHQLAADLDGLHVHRGVGRLRPRVERQAHDLDAQLGGKRQQIAAPPRGSQPNLRDRSHTASGLRNATRISSEARLRNFTNLRNSSGLSTTKT